jgi:hypothetical protein
VFKPQHLTDQEVDALYGEQLKQLEAMHLRATVLDRVRQSYGLGNWDPETGEDLIAAVRQEWNDLKAARGGD